MAKELICECCGKSWNVEGHPSLKVRVETCQKCGRFKFHLESATDHSTVRIKGKK